MGKANNIRQDSKMTKIFLKIFILWLISFSVLKAEIIKEISIEGNKRVSDQTIIIYGEININENYNESDLNKIIKNIYSTEFFEDVSAEINNNILKIIVKEYPVVNQLIIIGEKSNKYKDQIRKILKTKEKRSFIKSNLIKDIELVKKLYSSAGYNFAEVKTKIKKINEENLDLVFEISRGEITRISSIKFIGDKKIRENKLRDIVASEEDKFWKIFSRNTKFNENLINLDLRLLRNFYKSIGYYDVKINSNFAEINKKGNINLIYSIEAGKRYTINKISTNADKVFDKEIFFPLNKVYEKYVGDYYSPFKVKKILESIDELIEKRNLQFVEHNVQEIVENDSINIVFNIFEGEKILVERINITNEDVIRSELIIDEGDPYTNLSLKKSISQIKARNIFNDVSYQVKEGSKKNLKEINISVEEKPTGEISAGAGIGTSGGLIAFDVKENNWLGEGKRVGFSLEAETESLTGILSYTDPNYDFLGNSISYSFSSQTNDKPDSGYENSTVSAGVSTSFEQYKDLFANLGLSANYDDLRTDDTASSALKKQSGEFSEIMGSYGFSSDLRDRRFMPTSGSIIGFNQSLPIYADKASIGNRLSANFYKSLTEDIIGTSKFYFAAINGLNDDDVRLSKRIGLSSSRLRGFKRNKVGPIDGDDHIGGNYAASVNLEANLPNLLPESSNTDVGMFLDFGNVWGVDYDDTLDESNKWRSSVGLAASWSSPIGPMTFTLSQNINKASTDETEGFNFNLGTTF